MKRYVKASKDYDENGIISSEGDMTDFIHENYIIDNVIESVNDADYDWRYNTPEKFSAACKKYLTKNIASEIKDRGFKVKKGVEPVDLISNKIWAELKDEASSGDFDVDKADDEIDEELAKIYDAQEQEIDKAVAKYHGRELTDALNRIEKKYAKLFKQAGYED